MHRTRTHTHARTHTHTQMYNIAHAPIRLAEEGALPPQRAPRPPQPAAAAAAVRRDLHPALRPAAAAAGSGGGFGFGGGGGGDLRGSSGRAARPPPPLVSPSSPAVHVLARFETRAGLDPVRWRC